MGNFNLEDYEPVQNRIGKFLEKYSEGRVLTELIKDDGKEFTFKAILYRNNEDVILSTGYANEIKGVGFVNKTSACENAETSAIGRALANIGLHGDKRPSREEMQKVQDGDKKTASTKDTTKEKELMFLIAENLKKMGCVDKDSMRQWVDTKRINGGYPYQGVLSITEDLLNNGNKWDVGAKEFLKPHEEDLSPDGQEPLTDADIPDTKLF